MAVKRMDRINVLLRRAIGEALYQVFAGETIDLAAITVTQVDCAPNLRNATVMVSVYGHEDQRTRMITHLSRKAKDLQSIINRDLTLKYTPRLTFKLDRSIEKGDHVLALISRLNDEPEVENL
ncbi:MAG: 30S ribosome-binding factor RbfA [Kiritimatiellae bacterium]|nr:30S ribosome-binding factor RbfA [Kiritimatiellia bacterium]